jgi:acetaldehyde dehydrogenase
MMRDTVFCLTPHSDRHAISAAVVAMAAKVQEYVPGYRLKQEVQFEDISAADAHLYPDLGPEGGLKVSIFLEVEGAAHYLPAYAGNLDIMTSAALACGEHIAARLLHSQGA